jgi:hypothetical protein
MLNLSIHRILLAGIRDKGLCPCPRCLIPKADIHKLGQATDFASRIKKARTYIGDVICNARNWIYEGGLGIASAAVERVLKPESWTPTLVEPVKNYVTMCGLTSTFLLEYICRDPW